MYDKVVESASHRAIRTRQRVRTSGVLYRRVLRPLTRHTVDPSTLHFGQQHIHSVDVFSEPYHTVPAGRFPHYEFLIGNREAYRDYLRHSWDYYDRENSSENRERQVEAFEALLADINVNGIREPIQYVTRSDSRRVLYDGNHRTAIARYLDVPLPAVEISLSTFALKNALQSDAFYGTGRHGIPYQSVYRDGDEIIAGRRRDIADRLELVDTSDLQGNDVIDFGCNIGSSSFIAAEKGATVTGVEYDPEIVTSAIRLNVVFAHPCEFVQADLSEPVDLNQHFETGFCFSIDKHVDDDDQLARNIRRHVDDVLYFETHANSEIPTPVEALADSVEWVGETGPRSDRDLYRLDL